MLQKIVSRIKDHKKEIAGGAAIILSGVLAYQYGYSHAFDRIYDEVKGEERLFVSTPNNKEHRFVVLEEHIFDKMDDDLVKFTVEAKMNNYE